MRNRETGLRYANADPSLHCNGIEPRSDVRWRGAWFWCLRHCDYEAAELIASRNLISDECAAGAHNDCFFSWCTCNHHSAVQFELEHPQLRSAMQEEEMEVVL